MVLRRWATLILCRVRLFVTKDGAVAERPDHSSGGRIFLAVVGAAYLVLAIWCAVLPESTSRAVGFTLQPGSGQSEFYVVYGGLQLALVIAFLWPVRRPDETESVLRLCCLIHTCLVAFRTASLLRFDVTGMTTYALAGGEWIILIGAILVWKKAATREKRPV